ncbi:6-phospho-beta-glucosidase [Halalkalibacterium halodurans]|uniref:6-phospho-beta-glucosidase n=1 Tax=Halalkalibacterium halodurans (strain ATCC BAA-125 / DSM 18197 / FERM 7344 / JCM 9153 / C-125) TaxID=272558 RepID=Q9KEE0_HALH5|nr:6-phospho-beta-glucosidase [Halalkalibacterium halodurans]MED4082938.1 6-phospho-beta-glucosidase [Halalkalibacterium halodurans]MED4086769.1 6-phospho-beta-glucosidase [Halalkalibacterium halodurans]MED4106295.1 6-phospho-beta-glucosidase [Halalkalibacterium halodurans]MED4108833.1 6-phospho-beta-glucosidase [Halalkalibacterium halodurans]MED4125187.1 6-phospho-beta-glucosidase [Halalkalibacterium halodurans]
MSLKVVVIGGGSSYTPEIIEGLITRYDQIPVREIVLVDIEAGAKKVAIIEALSRRMIENSGYPIHVHSSFDLRASLEGANFVTTQIRVGGLEAREKDERIPLKHGLIGQETNGAGGVFKAFRTIPVLLEIAQAIHDICPQAWMINFTNPAGIVTEALLHHSPHKKVVGVCNIPFNMRTGIAEMFSCPVEQVEIEFIGMNHFVFGKRVFIHGEDRTTEALAKLTEDKVDYSPANIVSLGWSKAFVTALQLLPNPYHLYYFQTEEVLKKDLDAFRNNGTRAEIVKQVEDSLFLTYQNPSLSEKPKELEQRGGAYYSEAACNLMESLYTNKQDIQTVNTLNNGSIRDLPDDAVVEINAVITKDGPRPLAIGKIPPHIKGLIGHMKTFEQLVIKAALSGDYYDAYNALIMNPLVADEKKAKIVLDELLDAHKEHLPQFYRKGAVI